MSVCAYLYVCGRLCVFCPFLFKLNQLNYTKQFFRKQIEIKTQGNGVLIFLIYTITKYFFHQCKYIIYSLYVGHKIGLNIMAF